MRLTTDERRADPRRTIAKPCKLRLRTSGKYVAGTTRDVSSGGTLLILGQRSNLAPGDEVDVAIAWNDSAILRESDMMRGRVVRVAARTDDTEAIGIQLAAPVAALLAA